MAKAQYYGVNGVARKAEKQYEGVNGIARQVMKGYLGVNGVARQFFDYKRGIPIGEIQVGAIVSLPFNGKATKFIVVHQGNPNYYGSNIGNEYDSSCDGTWLLMNTEYTTYHWDSADNNYANSDVHSYLNSTTLGLFGADVRPYIKQVKIPYAKGNPTASLVGGENYTGANGLTAKLFLLSAIEVGFVNRGGSYVDDRPADGRRLSYFQSTNDNNTRRSTGNVWRLRSPQFYSTTYAFSVGGAGGRAVDDITTTRYLRPALILDSNALIDPDTNTFFVNEED